MAPVLEMKGLCIEARAGDGRAIPIVRDVSFEVARGEVVALIGESGSGKTTISLAALAYTRPGLEVAGGEVLLQGRDVLAMTPAEQRALRGNKVAYLAQSAAATFRRSIPPRMPG